MTGEVGRAIALSLAFALAACGGRETVRPPVSTSAAPPSRAPPPRSARPPAIVRQPVPAIPLAAIPNVTRPGATNAAGAGVVAGIPVAALPIQPDQAAPALAAFKRSCPTLLRRTDASGLTRNADWQPACTAAASADGDPLGFFRRWFESVQVGDGRTLATGYYVPEIEGSRERRAGYEVPIYARPDDLIDVDLGQFSDALKGKKIRGRVDGPKLVPYFERSQIEAGAIGGKARVLAWAADPVAVFFLQIQGSGLVRLPDDGVIRIGYDSQNGRDYTGIGALMKARGLLGAGQTSMQGIVGWLHDHPVEGKAIMEENRSFVFFRELDGPPLGALGLPVIGGTSAAADPKFVPLGAPVFLSLDRADATGLWVAQDTGGAIRGANRFDTFWGAGAQAESIAGGMSGRGTAFLLLPVGTVARLSNLTVPLVPVPDAGTLAQP